MMMPSALGRAIAYPGATKGLLGWAALALADLYAESTSRIFPVRRHAASFGPVANPTAITAEIPMGTAIRAGQWNK